MFSIKNNFWIFEITDVIIKLSDLYINIMTNANETFSSTIIPNFQKKLVNAWTKEDVRDWLNSCGFFDWCHHIAILS